MSQLNRIIIRTIRHDHGHKYDKITNCLYYIMGIFKVILQKNFLKISSYIYISNMYMFKIKYPKNFEKKFHSQAKLCPIFKSKCDSDSFSLHLLTLTVISICWHPGALKPMHIIHFQLGIHSKNKID